jgi:Co/Zn/Cd efflux system component
MGCPNCCGVSDDEENISVELRRALFFVVLLNGTMAIVGIAASFIGRSQAMQADSLDFLGDAIATAVSLSVLSRAVRVRARVAWWQGLVLGALGVSVVVGALYRFLLGGAPDAEVMSTYAIIGFIVNLSCALILLRHREGNSSVKAAWLYSRNDALGNISVLGAAVLIWLTASQWPDLLVAAILAALFIHSAIGIMRRAKEELRS